ncbi:MAG: hypothetical protein U0470_00080 [Anaerolineae bacterium]
MAQAQRRQPADDVQQRAQPVARWADAIRAHERRVHRGDVDLDDLLGDAGGEQVERAAGVPGQIRLAARRAVRQGRAGVEVGPHEHRLQDPHRRSGRRELLVAARGHPGQRERCAEQPAHRPSTSATSSRA